MKREIVLSVSGGRVLTGSGLRPVAGNSEFGTGAKVFILDNAILGQKRTQARRKPFEEIIITPQPPIPVIGYKFASGTTMYYTDLDFNILSEEVITPPVEGAVLLAHTYNGRVEYFVWFVDARCIIQKNGEAIADFVSEFYSVPDEIDAYVDDNDDLIWGAAGEGAGIVTMAAYKNGGVTKTASYSEAAIESQYAERIRQRAANLQFTATPAPRTPTTDVLPIVCPHFFLETVLYQAQYAGCYIRQGENAFYELASVGSGIIFDLFGAGAMVSVSSSASTYIEQRMEATSWDSSIGTYVDQSYAPVAQVTHIHNVSVHRVSDSEVVGERQEQTGPSDEIWRAPYFDEVSEYADTPVDFSAYVVEKSGITRSSSRFVLHVIDLDASGLITTLYQNGFVYSITSRDGENAGQTRQAKGTPYHRENNIDFEFSEAWPAVPALGGGFTVHLFTGYQTQHSTECDLRVVSSYPAINTEGGTVATSRGNGYATTKSLRIESVFGWVSDVGALLYNGQKIHDAQENNFLDGAWSTEDGKAAGVAGYEVIKAEGAAVELIEPQFNPSVATKRFTGVTL